MENRWKYFEKIDIFENNDFLFDDNDDYKPMEINFYEKANIKYIKEYYFPVIYEKMLRNKLTKKEINLNNIEKPSLLISLNFSIITVVSGKCDFDGNVFYHYKDNNGDQTVIIRPFAIEFLTQFKDKFNITLIYVNRNPMSEELFKILKEKLEIFNELKLFSFESGYKPKKLQLLDLSKNVIIFDDNYFQWDFLNKNIAKIYIKKFWINKYNIIEGKTFFINNNSYIITKYKSYFNENAEFSQFKILTNFFNTVYEEYIYKNLLYYNNFNQKDITTIINNKISKIFNNMNFSILVKDTSTKLLLEEMIKNLGGKYDQNNIDDIWIIDPLGDTIKIANRNYYRLEYIFNCFFSYIKLDIQDYLLIIN